LGGDEALGAIGRESQLRDARAVAARIGIELIEVATNEVDDPRYAQNAEDRCYFCKQALFAELEPLALQRGATVVDGYNADDAKELLYGRRAATEHAVRSPLFEAGLTKADVRRLAGELGLPTADKPAAACLASRVPTGTPVTREILRQIELAERALRALGLRELRVRHHGDVARIETGPDELMPAIEQRDAIVAALTEVGYRFVALDLRGYRRGSVAATEAIPIRFDATIR